MPKLDPRSLIEGLSDVQKLVHLAARFDQVDVDEWRVMLLKQRRAAYESELSIQAKRVGCGGQIGRLANGPILSQLNEASTRDSESIANTFNYFLAAAIIRIGEETPTANRNVYARRLGSWESTYWGWKQGQIDQMTDNSARALAQQHFYQFNNQMGTAELYPKSAVCPICQGWVARGVEWPPQVLVLPPQVLVLPPQVLAAVIVIIGVSPQLVIVFLCR